MLALRMAGELTTPEVRGAGVVERGAGGWAATAHVPGLAALDGYELRALSASSAESAPGGE
jgi:hypothetical protein